MRFAINKWRTSNKDISDVKIFSFKKTYFNHLLRLGLKENSPLITYFAMPFFHDSVLTRFEIDSWKNEATIEIVRQEADLEDINEWRIGRNLLKLSESSYMKKPIIYRFDFKSVLNTRYSFSGKYIESFWIMDAEIDKQGSSFLLTIGQDVSTVLSLTFSSCKFSLINAAMIKQYTNDKLEKLPYCESCTSKMMSIQKIRKLIDEGKR